MPLKTQLEHGRFLSHLSFEFLHGSQLIAFLALFVGGLGSCSFGGGLVLDLTFVDLGSVFERCWSSAMTPREGRN